MGKFTKVSEDAFDSLQLDAGVILSVFNPANPVAPDSADIIATTTGGISVSCTPSYSDFGDDVDNVPVNMMEFKHLDSWECTMSFSSIKFNASNTKWALGAADKTSAAGYSKITPRRNLSQSDFSDIWWVGDKANGGAYAVKLKNALSTGGMSIQSSKNGKGTNQMTLTGHVSISAQDDMPMEFYEIEPDGESGTLTITQNLGDGVTSTITETSVDYGDSLSGALTDAETVTVTMGGVDVTAEVYDAETGAISITAVTGDVVITAEAGE